MNNEIETIISSWKAKGQLAIYLGEALGSREAGEKILADIVFGDLFQRADACNRLAVALYTHARHMLYKESQ